jgi:hypothetical protein
MKVKHAQLAGYTAAIVFDNQPGDLVAMSSEGAD